MELTKNSMFLINKNEAVVCENNHRKELSEPQVFLTIPDNELGIKDWLNQLENDQKLYKGDDNLFCEDCGHRSDSDIVTKSIKAHEILALCNAKSKNSIGNIPNRVSLGQSQYEIFGIISYSEKHYIAYTREEGIWNEYNDQEVRENKSPNPKTSYMLFYRKTYH
ncbi:unnamed protein product [Blepharisma stoltei]|uniref:USP domain-containing protein n=1 Tax=Blepharisma stoltei TaxID=1481888 RepID=A0AAU9IFV3_9CILI|nr:unnamed protein product [Blepharisma stoltei]